jgi:hypothetical protein
MLSMEVLLQMVADKITYSKMINTAITPESFLFGFSGNPLEFNWNVRDEGIGKKTGGSIDLIPEQEDNGSIILPSR